MPALHDRRRRRVRIPLALNAEPGDKPAAGGADVLRLWFCDRRSVLAVGGPFRPLGSVQVMWIGLITWVGFEVLFLTLGLKGLNWPVMLVSYGLRGLGWSLQADLGRLAR